MLPAARTGCGVWGSISPATGGAWGDPYESWATGAAAGAPYVSAAGAAAGAAYTGLAAVSSAAGS